MGRRLSRWGLAAERWGEAILPCAEPVGDAAAREAGWWPDGPGDYCARCGATASAAAVTLDGCPHCRGQRVVWDGVWRLGPYDEPVSRWVIDLKFHRAWGWGRWFGRQLGEMTRRVGGERAVVVPVPLHWRRRMGRGYDQALLIAKAFAAERGLPLAPLLRRHRRTEAQTRLASREARRRNVKRAFTAAAVDLNGWTVWLVDDVKTTGATAGACARLLRRAGAASVRLAVVAVADPRGGDFKWSGGAGGV